MVGCSTPLANSVVPNAADLWVGQYEGTGLWSAEPGNANIEIEGVDADNGVFPPLIALDTAANLSAPLHLVPGRHSIKFRLSTAFFVHSNPGPDFETVQVSGTGNIEEIFLENHGYRLTGLWINGSGTFEVTLWDVTRSNDSPATAHSRNSWSFRGKEVIGPPGYVP
jgi:hypothetical protein